jgi:hypothetical protein
MSLHDSFTFPEFLPLGLVVRPCGGIKPEPPDVKVEEDLPRRFMFGCLQKGSFRKTESGQHRGFVCQGPELAGATIEYRANKIRQVAFNIRCDPSKLVSLTDSDAELDEMIHTVQRKSLTLRDEVESELRGNYNQ